MDIYAIATQRNLDLISRHCPRALTTYIHCLSEADESGNAVFSKEKVTHDFSESYIKFRNNLKMLALEDILEWHEIDLALHVTICGDK